MTTLFSATKVSNISHYFMNRYHHIPEGCIPRKPLSQTCQHEVQSERYQIVLIIPHKQITCTYVMCCSGELVHSETIVQLLSSTTALLCISPFHGKVPYIWEKNVFSAWEKMGFPPHIYTPHFCWGKRHLPLLCW